MKTLITSIMKDALSKFDIESRVEDIIYNIDMDEIIEDHISEWLDSYEVQGLIESKVKDFIDDEMNSYDMETILESKIDDCFR